VCILQGTIYFRMLRLLRLLSLFKVERQVRAFAVMQKVLVSKMSQLLVCLYAMIVIVALFGSCMYFLVRDHAPKQQST
jgi:predicted metal-dependent hydrolase